MQEEMNEKTPPGSGLFASLKIIVAVLVIIIAGAAMALVLDLITLEAFKVITLKSALVGGVAAVASIVLGLLAGGRRG